MNETQVCARCGIEKPISEFNRDRTRPNGHNSRCKACVREYMKSYMKSFRRKLRLPTHPLLQDGIIVDGKFAGCRLQELIDELKRLGFKGTLRYISLEENEIEI